MSESKELKTKDIPCCIEYLKVKCTECKNEHVITVLDKDISCQRCVQRKTILIRKMLKEYSCWSIGFSKEIIHQVIEDQRLSLEITHKERLMLDTVIEKIDPIVQKYIHEILKG